MIHTDDIDLDDPPPGRVRLHLAHAPDDPHDVVCLSPMPPRPTRRGWS